VTGVQKLHSAKNVITFTLHDAELFHFSVANRNLSPGGEIHTIAKAFHILHICISRFSDPLKLN
jgi:hypothetical protein